MDVETEGLLINLIEEAAEVTQIAAKCLRFGLFSYDPTKRGDNRVGNYILLGREIGNLQHIITRLEKKGVIYRDDQIDGQLAKQRRLNKYPLIVEGDKP